MGYCVRSLVKIKVNNTHCSPVVPRDSHLMIEENLVSQVHSAFGKAIQVHLRSTDLCVVHNEFLFSDYKERSFVLESDRLESLPVVLLGQCRTGENVIIHKT